MRFRIASILCAALITFVACYSKPPEPQLPADGDGGVPGDGRHLDAGIDAYVCTTTTIADFAGAGTGCPSAAFSTLLGVGTSISYNEALQITVPASVGESASCQTKTAYDATGGFAVQLTVPPMVPSAAATFRVYLQAGAISLTITKSTQAVATVTCPDTSTNSLNVTHTAPYWLRFKGDGAANETIDVGISANGTSYTSIKTCQLTGPAGSATAELGASGGSGSDDTIEFDNLKSCP